MAVYSLHMRRGLVRSAISKANHAGGQAPRRDIDWNFAVFGEPHRISCEVQSEWRLDAKSGVRYGIMHFSAPLAEHPKHTVCRENQAGL